MMSGQDTRRHPCGGFMLVEAMISLIIVSFGLLALGKLNAVLLTNSAISKTRTEAVQCAESQLARLSAEFHSSANCATLITTYQNSPPTPPACPNTGLAAGLTPSVTYAATTKGIRATVNVAWTDAENKDQDVSVTTELACENPANVLNTVAGTLPEANIFTMPGGNTKLFPNVAALDDSKVVGQPDAGAETRIDGTTVQLTRQQGGKDVVMLQMKTSNPGQGFSIISGEIYISKSHTLGTGNRDLDINKVKLIPSGAAICNRLFSNGSDFQTDWTTTTPTLVDRTNYWSFSYKCYLGEGWYGNIGIVRTDVASNSDRICVGDPAVDPNTALWTSRHPALTTTRQYRGYRFVNNVKYEIGIGIDPSTQVYTAAAYTGHKFFLTPISGQVNDAKCEGVDPVLMVSSFFTDNPGKNYCMTGNCPGESVIDPALFVFSGKINYASASMKADNALLAVALDTGLCALEAIKDSAYYFDYNCTLNFAGWTGEKTIAALNLTLITDYDLCTDPGEWSMLPAGFTPIFTTGTVDTISFVQDITNLLTITLDMQISNKVNSCRDLKDPLL